MTKKICILGMGYVGLTLSVVMADVGFEVLGVEVNPRVLNKLRELFNFRTSYLWKSPYITGKND